MRDDADDGDGAILAPQMTFAPSWMAASVSCIFSLPAEAPSTCQEVTKAIEHSQQAARYRDQNRIHACLFLRAEKGNRRVNRRASDLSMPVRPPLLCQVNAALWEEAKGKPGYSALL